MSHPRREAAKRLFDITEDQQGFFTAKQAKAAGYAENTHPYHVHSGNWIREHRGVYRLAHFPRTGRPDLMLWSLWSRNRADAVQGVYSHETALSLYDLTDVMPAKIHMTVPLNFRRNSAIPGVLILHRADLSESDTHRRDGVRLTTPLRTILDVQAEQCLPISILRQAVRDALSRGLIRQSEVASAGNQLSSDCTREFAPSVIAP
jgi:predicted transcriptional regulator of viral defense system